VQSAAKVVLTYGKHTIMKRYPARLTLITYYKPMAGAHHLPTKAIATTVFLCYQILQTAFNYCEDQMRKPSNILPLRYQLDSISTGPWGTDVCACRLLA
jgi:hypothetical protein